jgi:hypothetical protein
LGDVTISLAPGVASARWRQLADHERFFTESGLIALRQPVDDELYLPSLGCALWILEA